MKLFTILKDTHTRHQTEISTCNKDDLYWTIAKGSQGRARSFSRPNSPNSRTFADQPAELRRFQSTTGSVWPETVLWCRS